MSRLEEQYKEMVIYLLKGKFTEDEEVIQGYTDSLVNGAKEYAKEQVEKVEASPLATTNKKEVLKAIDNE